MHAKREKSLKSLNSVQEDEANLFARLLLMPEPMVREFCQKRGINDMNSDKQIGAVANHFNVPIAVAAIRLSEIYNS